MRTPLHYILALAVLPLLSWTVQAAGDDDASAAKDIPVRVARHVAMSADFEIQMFGASPDTDPEAMMSAAREAFEAVDALEAKISRWQNGSVTSMINRNAAEHPVKTPSDYFDLMQHARRLHEATQGAFDVTVGPLLELWGFYQKEGRLPDSEMLKQTLEHVGLSYVRLDKNERTVFFERPGMRLDFGGIGKGLALDRAAAMLVEQGITQARLIAGSSTLVALGAPPGKAGWTVDIQSPYNKDEGAHIATVDIRNESLSTSSGAERYVEIDGKKYSHIFDPRTGMPVSGIASATAIAPSGLESDALSTAFYVMGVEATRTYCAAHPEVRAILIVQNNESSDTIYINFSSDSEKEQS